jgi:hypothetical protein
LRDKLLEQLAKAAFQSSWSHRESQAMAYLADPPNKALAAYPTVVWRTFSQASEAIAEDRALEGCQIFTGQPCVLVARNDVVVSDDVLKVRRSMPRVEYDGFFLLTKIPTAPTNLTNPLVAGYSATAPYKAMALHPYGLLFTASGASNQREAEEMALTACNSDPVVSRNKQDGSCFLYAIGLQVVLPKRATAPISEKPG